MTTLIRNVQRAALVVGVAAALLAPSLPVLAQANEQFVALPSYRVGPYGANGQSFYGGFIDYLNYVNLKDGGVNGVKLSWEECETEYNNAKGVECYERLKSKNATTKGTAYHSMSTGISYALVDKTAADKVPLVMMGYGRTDAVDGSVFPYAFPLVTTYQMQVSAIVKYLASKSGGSLNGKKIVYLYHDSAYGKEPDRRPAGRGAAEQVQPGGDSGGAPGQRAGRPVAQDPPGEPGLRDLLGLGCDEPDGAEGGAEGGLLARQDDRLWVGRLRGGHRAGRRCRQGLHERDMERGGPQRAADRRHRQGGLRRRQGQYAGSQQGRLGAL